MEYEKYCESVGIIQDEETREVWEYQQKRFDGILDTIEDMIIEAVDNPEAISHEPFISLLHKVGNLRDDY